MRGRWISLSIPRRVIADLMYFSAQMPAISAQREMSLSGVAAARTAGSERPPWPAVFTKAYAMVAAEFPELRRAYVQLPWPHLYEYPASVASVAVERSFDQEPGVCFVHIKRPALLAVEQVGQLIKAAKQDAFEQTKSFRWMVRIAKCPMLLRRVIWWIGLNWARQRANYFGTFALSTVSSLGTDILNPRSPATTLLTYGVISGDGRVTVRVIFDHRVVDAATVARALTRLEDVLNGPIADELRQSAKERSETGPPLPDIVLTPSMIVGQPVPMSQHSTRPTAPIRSQ